MKQLLAALFLFLLVGVASAATVEYKDDNVTVQLYDTPCVSEKIVALVGKIDGAQAAQISFKGQVLEACWVLDGDYIDIIDEEGQTAENVSPSIFQVVKEI